MPDCEKYPKANAVYHATPNGANKQPADFLTMSDNDYITQYIPTTQNNSEWARNFRGEAPKNMSLYRWWGKHRDIGHDVGRRERMLKWGY